MFSVDVGGNNKYVCLMTMRHPGNKFSFLVADMQATFQLSPDLLIVRHSTSFLGGLFSSSHDEIKSVPHAITMPELGTLLDYFDMIAFDRFLTFLHNHPATS
jgi:hypothetical protein